MEDKRYEIIKQALKDFREMDCHDEQSLNDFTGLILFKLEVAENERDVEIMDVDLVEHVKTVRSKVVAKEMVMLDIEDMVDQTIRKHHKGEAL